MNLIMPININMTITIGILTFIRLIRTTSESLKARKGFICQHFSVFFFKHLDEEERAGCLTLFVFLKSCEVLCSVALPHGAMG